MIGGSQAVRGRGSCGLNATVSGSRSAVSIDARVLVLSGEPIDEPVVGQGPFVMNRLSSAEIRQAILDYQGGRMGTLD